MKNVKYARFYGFIVDYLIWYILMVVMLFVSFLFIHKETAFAGNLAAYQVIFDRIMHEPTFILIYTMLLVVYEIIVPLITHGQTLSKKLLHIQVKKVSNKDLCIRGLLKILIINPCGIIAYMVGSYFGQDVINMVSNILTVILCINMIAYAMNRECMHSILSHTNIELAS